MSERTDRSIIKPRFVTNVTTRYAIPETVMVSLAMVKKS